MPTRYVYIRPIQEPMDLGMDELKRTKFAFNIYIVKRPSGTLLEELAGRLEDESVGTLGTDIFATSGHTIPAGDGPFLSLRETGGVVPMATQNADPAYQRPAVQIVARAASSVVAKAKAVQAYNALISVKNMDL